MRIVILVVLAALVPWLTLHRWLPAVCKALMPIGVTFMEDVRIPEGVIDFFTRPALRLGFVALVQDLEGTYFADMDMPLKYAQKLREMPIALYTPDANEQHYEVETQFFDVALGARKKYSMGLWDVSATDWKIAGAGLEKSEDAMLDEYVKRAGITDGMTIFDLGCGWGSVSLFLAERFPKARIIGVSNSRTQRKYIMETAGRRGHKNVEIHTMNVAGPEFEKFLGGLSLDRIISIEMFEHMKNYPELLKRLSTGLKPGGKLFLHFFCHKYLPYDFREEDELNQWMTLHFFKGGTMPSQHLMLNFQEHLKLERQWNVNGMHYMLTSEAWLQRMDARRDELLKIFGGAENPEAKLQLRRWRIFMIAVAEFFGFRDGTEFFVTHMLFSKPS